MTKLINFFRGIYTFIRYDIWRITEFELSRTRIFLYRLVKIIILATRGFINERLNVKASALTYSILFAVVPMFALIIAIGRGFGVEGLIQKALQESFVAQADMLPTVMGMVSRYLETTQGGLFIGIGLAILIISVMNFFMQVEMAFNSIWQVKKARSVVNQFTMYFSAMLIIPILIVLSSGISIYLSTELSKTMIYNLISPLLRFGVKFAPYLLNWIIFTMLYLIIPNTKVRFVNALIAGVIAGTAFQLFQALYINGQVYLSRYNVVYGSFAAIPLLLLWLQISCLIVLLGAEISYASQNIQNFDYEIDSRNISRKYKNFLTLFIVHLIVKQFEAQKPPLSPYQIAANYHLPIRLVNQILSELVDVNILIEVFCESKRNKTFQPAMDINQLTISVLYEKLENFGSDDFLLNKNPDLDDFRDKISAINDNNRLIRQI
ncbi:MAG: YihY/virulence factor BrkB family protein [Paludibacteraceae bacterium]|nr:YihY/virulence factor BrkB family protein [Paludibacteraceae bacterium]